MTDPTISGPGAAAYREALRLLGRRPRTCEELRQSLEQRDHEAPAIEAAVDRLRGEGYLDDVALSCHFISARSTRLGHGRERLARELERRGVSAADFSRAWRQLLEDGELDPEALLRREVRRRAGSADLGDRRVLRRVYNSLRRAGFEGGAIRAELESQGVRHDSASLSLDGVHDELA